METIQVNKRILKDLCREGTPLVTERKVCKDKLVLLGYIDLNEILENTLFHLSCPIKHFVIIQYRREGHSVLIFDKEKEAKTFYKKQLNLEIQSR